jgi:hypothetical protein
MSDDSCETKLVLDKKGKLIPRCFSEEVEAADWIEVYCNECTPINPLDDSCIVSKKCPSTS